MVQALRLKPDFVAAHVNLGIVLHSQGKFEQAISCYKKALRFNPNIGEAYLNLGNALNKLNNWEEAIDAYNKCLAIKPNHVMTYSNLGAVLRNTGKLNQAEACFRKALALAPDFSPTYINLGTLLTDLGKTADAIKCFEQSLAIKPDRAEALSNMLFSLNYIDIIDPQTLAQKYFQMGAKFEKNFLPARQNHNNNPDPNRKLRIGYVSPDFRRHAITFFFEPLMRAHHRNMFEIFCYAEVFMPDEMTIRLQTLADHWLSTVGMTDDELADRIRADGIDVLIDLAGHSAFNRLLTFIRRPAPVQVTWLGYPNTTGLTTMDYRLVDAITDPEGSADTLATETLIRMKDGFHCYQVPVGVPEPVAPPCLKTGVVTFGSFNNIAKISPSTMNVWGKLLTRLPTARLLLKSWIFADEDIRALILSRLAERGIVAERVTLLEAIANVSDHIGAYRQIDIALDSFPYNGTTTTCEALWMGVPVVTMLGDRHLSRVGASLLTQVGLEELIARNQDDYINIAAKLANDYPKLSELHSGLRARMAASPLCDATAFAHKIEGVYQDLWRRWCERTSAVTAQGITQYNSSQNNVTTLKPINAFHHPQTGQTAVAESFLARGEIEKAVEYFSNSLALQSDPALHSKMLLCMHYRSRWNPQEIFSAYHRFDDLYCSHFLKGSLKYTNRKNEQRKIKVGYVSTSFRTGPVGYFIKPILRYFDRSQFEVYAYHVGHKETLMEDELTADLCRLAVNWRSLPCLEDELLSNVVRTDGIDILVDLCGHFEGNRLLAFARKPAPIQMTWLYPDTTGLTAMDYRLVDLVSDPIGNADDLSSERLVRLEGGFLCFIPQDSTMTIGPLPALQQGTITFGVFAHHEKISEKVLQTWAEIIKQVPGSRILLQSDIFDSQDNRNVWKNRLASFGISQENQILAGNTEGYLENYNKVDIGLDTFPYNGMTSTCNALWLGVPVVTLAGDRHASRIGVSIMTHSGFSELVASNYEDYIKLAVNLASDRNRLIALRLSLRERLLRSPLCDANRFVRYLEIAYHAMWKKWCNEQPVEAICVQVVQSVAPASITPTLSVERRENNNQLSYHAAQLADAEVGLRSKRVIEVGCSLPPDFVFDVLGVTQWVSIQSPRWFDEASTGNRDPFCTVKPVMDISAVTTPSQLARHSILSGSIEDLPVSLHGCFDVVFSNTGFERILRLGHTFEVMAAALIPEGRLFATFSPIWTAYNGYHLSNLTDRSGRIFDFNDQSPIPPWAHLYWRPPQMYAYLLQRTDAATAAEIVYFVYHSPQINRLFVEDYVEYFTTSPFVGQVVKTNLTIIPSTVQEQLELLYPTRRHFDNCGLKLVLSRRSV